MASGPFWRLACAVVVLLAAACTEDEDAQDTGASSAGPASTTGDAVTLEPDCPPPPDRRGDARAAADVNRLLSDADLPAWEAADSGASVPMSDGRIVWAFGDTLSTSGGPDIVANSMLISSGPCVSQVVPADHGPVIPDVSARVVHWPMSVLAHRVDGHPRLAVLCARVRRGTSGGSLDFTYLGSSAAVFDVPNDGVPRLRGWEKITPDNPDPHQVNWGAASFHDGRWIYVYGTRLTDDEFAFGRELYVARAPLANPTDRTTYRFWDGQAWQADRAGAAAMIPAHGGVSQTLSVHQMARGRYLAVSKRPGDLGDFVYTWEAPTPHGPWNPQQEVPAPNDFDQGTVQYAPLAHPEVPLHNGKLLVSVSRNTTDLERLVEQPELGVPNFVDVDYP